MAYYESVSLSAQRLTGMRLIKRAEDRILTELILYWIDTIGPDLMDVRVNNPYFSEGGDLDSNVGVFFFGCRPASEVFDH
jgi:hypothetical protein